ncbi:MAG: helix-turn-helix domain-containing protein, partial [bacterium]
MEDEDIETVGKYLRSAREKHNLTQKDIAGITKIRHQYIDAIEQDNFLSFPSSYTIKGYIKAIAEATKADEYYALELYGAANKNISEIKHEDIVKQKFIEEHQKLKKIKKRVFILLIIIIAIVLIIIGLINIKKVVTSKNFSSKLFAKKNLLKSKYNKNEPDNYYDVILNG